MDYKYTTAESVDSARRSRSSPVCLAMLIAVLIPTIASAQSTTFTYQGKLADNGAPATGHYDMVFRVFDADVGGTQIGSDIGAAVPVAAGLFTIDLDFGPSIFDASPRWLEAEVNLQPLAPRQQITSTPFAQTAIAAHYAHAPWITSGANLYYHAGNVGIGTSTPSARLDIGGEAGTDGIRFPDGSLQTTAAIGGAGGDSIWSLNGTSAYYNAGQVGIGRNNPPDPLSFANLTGDKISLFGDAAGTYGFGIQASLLQIHTNNGLAHIAFGYGPSASFTERMRITGAGNLGIGTTTPASKLDIIAVGDGTSVLRFGTERPWNFRQAYTGSGTALRLQPETGLKNFEITAAGGTNIAAFIGDDTDTRVGIGTIAPTARLHVAGRMKIDGQNTLEFGAGIAKESSAGKIGYQAFGANNSLDIVGAGTLGTNRKINMWAEGGTFFTGSISTTILQIRGGADLAEPFDINGESIEPGMVVAIDPSCPGQLKPSDTPYDRRVAGVISGAGGVATGLSMGHEGTIADGEYLVALTGRVYCMVDASSAAVEPGDLLTTSSLRGHAMRANDSEAARGAVIGKAMTGLPKGERGLVLVLINLQ